MEGLLTVLEAYQGILLLAGTVLLMILVISVFIMMHVQRKTNRMILGIQKKVQSYLEVVMEDAREEIQEPDPVSRQEQQMRESLEKKQQQQEEAIFDAVLKEIFP
ncbi:MAG: hypothetical protein K2O73_08570 [Lachnospiraceae bacterium]|nr:hypothetical protein [Lachnospiraceae bacterium]MDE7435811.1 hypothetical protein [Lachnospiraceae bacterium]